MSKVFKRALKHFNAAAVELKVNATTKSLTKSLPFSYDKSMQLTYGDLMSSVGPGGKIPGSIFGEILLPGGGVSDITHLGNSPWPLRIPDTIEDGPYSEIPVSTTQSCADLLKEIHGGDYSRKEPTSDGPVKTWWKGKGSTFPENPYCTRSQLLDRFTPEERPLIESGFLVDDTWVLSHTQVLYFYGRILRPFLRFRGMRLPPLMSVIQVYRRDMNELLEYLLTVFPPLAKGKKADAFARYRPFKLVPHGERLSLKRP